MQLTVKLQITLDIKEQDIFYRVLKSYKTG